VKSVSNLKYSELLVDRKAFTALSLTRWARMDLLEKYVRKFEDVGISKMLTPHLTQGLTS
jgi:hypothetical protein